LVQHIKRHDHRLSIVEQSVAELQDAHAESLGVRQGWLVKLVSNHGEAVLPVVLRRELAPGRLSVPFAFRYVLADVLAGMPSASVRVERV